MGRIRIENAENFKQLTHINALIFNVKRQHREALDKQYFINSIREGSHFENYLKHILVVE